ncbi:hypothetical protein [uncultured Winogradskyella sp.]|uniref:hypothetical protein n=1 Tax=uncultured Winogradskyella sp. TaxID=395353 RepID=UPI00262CE741|nr:hypothetical protein [uncultured Winogradskyella sp.]
MKKLLLILLTLSLVTACDNEPLDPDLTGQNPGGGNGGGNNTSDAPLALSAYTFDTSTSVPFFGEIIVDIDYSFNSDNLISGAITESPVFGQDITTNSEFLRDSNNNIIQSNTYYLGALSDVTTITYNASNQVTQITYNDIESDDEDYEYNYTYDGNVVTKTEVGSDIITIYTFNNNNQLIRKESFQNDISIQLEELTYDTMGNVISSVMSGEINTTSTYSYDTFENPLVEPFQARDYYSSIGDEYDDQAANSIAQFGSTNNWVGITSDVAEFNFTVTYDDSDRILTRSGSFGDDDIQISQSEIFTYVN